jgi:hypothetical protein
MSPFSRCGSLRNINRNRDFGLAAIRAYAVYNDQTYLESAIEAWQYVSSYTISARNVVSASIVGKNFSLETICQGSEDYSCISVSIDRHSLSNI